MRLVSVTEWQLCGNSFSFCCFPFLNICFDPLGLAGRAVASHTQSLFEAFQQCQERSRLWQQAQYSPVMQQIRSLSTKLDASSREQKWGIQEQVFLYLLKDGCLVSLNEGKSYLELRGGRIREDYSWTKSSIRNITVILIVQFCSFLGRKVFPFVV